jgi:hypothetical protein
MAPLERAPLVRHSGKTPLSLTAYFPPFMR